MANFNGYDYQELAEVLYCMAQRKDIAGKIATSILAQGIASQLALDNPEFDGTVFMRAARTGRVYGASYGHYMGLAKPPRERQPWEDRNGYHYYDENGGEHLIPAEDRPGWVGWPEVPACEADH